MLHLFWWHSGILSTITHCFTHKPVPLCQHKLGMKKTQYQAVYFKYIYHNLINYITITCTMTKMNISPTFSQPIKTAVKTRKYNINNISIYIEHAMSRIMAALWALCLKRCPHIKTASSLNIIIKHNF